MPPIPKDKSYMPSQWAGDFDFAWTYDQNADYRDLYFRIYNEVIVDPDNVYKKIKTMVESNKKTMTREFIPIKSDGNLKIIVHNKITIEIMSGDILTDDADIKCLNINWHLNGDRLINLKRRIG